MMAMASFIFSERSDTHMMAMASLPIDQTHACDGHGIFTEHSATHGMVMASLPNAQIHTYDDYGIFTKLRYIRDGHGIFL